MRLGSRGLARPGLGGNRPDLNINDATRKPRPTIVKFTSYESRRKTFTSKCKLKGTKLIITEHLTKRRAELLSKARALDIVKAAWTIDGRIVSPPKLQEGDHPYRRRTARTFTTLAMDTHGESNLCKLYITFVLCIILIELHH